MSIYATWLDLSEDDHAEGCAVFTEIEPGWFELSGYPCDCGTPRAPLVYQGSQVLPADTDERGGMVEVAAIPSHITRNGRDDAPEGGLKDWLRLGVNEGTVVLPRPLVAELRDTLTQWLDAEERA